MVDRMRHLLGRTAAAVVVLMTLGSATANAEIPRGVSSLAAADVIFDGQDAGEGAGLRVGPAGDLDGDGFEDAIVGAWLNSTTGDRAGAAYVLYGPFAGGRIGLAEADAKLLGERTGDFAGEGWAGVGDLDGDGFDDFVVGAPGRDPAVGQPGEPAPGTAYLFYGSSRRLDGVMSLAAADAKLVGASDVDFAGVAVANATDLDRDGFHDLVIGAPLDDAGGPQAGAVYVFRGGADRLESTVELAEADATLLGGRGRHVGFALERGGDVNGDGFGELLIGAPALPVFGGSGLAATYLHYGSERSLAGRQRLSRTSARFVGEDADDRPGWGLGGGGDLDEDGFDDIVVGADLEDTAGDAAGAAYVFYGRERRFARTVSLRRFDAKLVGQAARDRAGYSAAIAGDVNEDGFDDLAVGAFGNDAAGEDAGATYVIFGSERRLRGRRGLARGDAVLLGEAAGDFAGDSVGPAGDLNGDDVDDLMIGADGADTGALDAGAVYTFFGGRG